MDVFAVSAPKSATGEGNSTETPVTNAKHKRSISKDKVYDENLVGRKVKVWWHLDKMYYEGVVVEFYPDRKRHKVSYVDGDEETLNLKEEKWKILKKFSGRDVEEQNTEKIGKDNDLKESENENVKYIDVKESENQNENDNHVKISEKEAVIPPETEKDKETIQEFSLKAVESKCAATANVSSPCQSNGVLNESSVRSNQEKPVPQEVETASPSKSQSSPDETHVKKEMDISAKSALKSASREGNLTETPVTSAKRKHSTSKDKVYNTLRYDESLVGTKVWWHGDKMYYEGVISEYYPDRKKHKVSYVDGDEEALNLREEKWKFLKKFSGGDVEEQNTEKIGKDNDLKESENENAKYNDVKESENQNENDNHVKKSENKAVIPPETEKGKDTVQEFSPKAVESKHAATANVSSPSQSNSVLDESSIRFNKEKPIPQEVETASPSKSQSPPDETRVDVSQKSASKAASREVSDTISYDESLVGLKVKVWWSAYGMYYEGVVAEFYPEIKKHKVSYVDGDVEILDLRTLKWKILKETFVRDDQEHNTEVQSEEGSPDILKKKKPKTDAAASQEKIKDSAMKVGDVSSSGESKGSTPKDNLSTQKNSGKSCDAATTASKEAAKSKEDEETLKINSKMKTVNKSNGKAPPSSSKFNVRGPTKAEKMEYDKERLRLEAEKLKIKADKGQSKIRLQDERLRLKAEKMKLLKKESDIRIMMIDARVMPEMQRLYFEKLQREIIMRHSYA